MSETKPIETADDFVKKIEETAKIEKLKSDTANKKAVLDNKKVTAALELVQRNENELNITLNTNFGALTKEQIEQLQKDNDEYMEAAKHQMLFVCDTFVGVVPFFRKNFILIGGRTGDGKSTTVANIVYKTLTTKDPRTNKTRRVLVLTNEEKAEDFYNRVTCLIKGWHYTNHSKFTDEQRKTFNEFIPKLSSNGRLTVVDNCHGGSHGVTTSIEGIQAIFDNLIANQEWYDVVIIDYYQNIIHSKNFPHLSENEIQARLARMIDNYKNIYPAPIVMMTQVTPPDKDNKVPFQQRIKGRKIIMDPATFVVEMVADRKNLRTQWIVHKSRYTESVGMDIFTGYDHGRFVVYSSEFAEKVQMQAIERATKRMNEQIDKSNGIKEVFSNEK